MIDIRTLRPELWPVLFGLGLVVIAAVLYLRSKRPRFAAWAYLISIWTGLVGSRLWHALQYGDFSLAGGLSAWGFAIGASLGAFLYLRLTVGGWGEDFWDAATPGIAAAGALTRIGCFWAGCNFGKPSDLAWSVRYGPHSPAFHHQVSTGILDPGALWSKPIHPAQLYEGLALFLALPVLFLLPRLVRLNRHELFLGFTTYYAVARFFLEYARDDAGGVALGPLTFAQGTSLGIAILASSRLVLNRRRA